MLLAEVVDTSRLVTEERGRLKKIGFLSACLARFSPEEIEPGVAFLSGELPQGRIGLGFAAVRDAMPQQASESAVLSVTDAHTAFSQIASMKGAGSAKARLAALAELLSRATRDEQSFLARLVFRELRQGAQEGIMIEAVAKAAGVGSSSVRRASMLAGDMVRVAVVALSEGEPGLAAIRLELLTPVKLMLAQSAETVAEVFSRYQTIAIEYKFDGARIQVHRAGDEVRVFTRNLNDVTGAVPEVVEAILALPVSRLVLDGETLVMRDNGQPAAFQTTMRRFGRRLDVAEMREKLPLSWFFFDCLHLDGEDLIDRPGSERTERLRAVLPPGAVVPGIVTSSPGEARTFVDDALKAGHEGVMCKSPDSLYEAGRRGAGWIKLKPVHTLDLVVLAVEWGSGRRSGWLSNLHLGALHPDGGFVMLGKTFKGMTDEILKWQTEKLLEIEVSRDRHVVHVRPELVVEIAFDGVQRSSQYPGGMALRFARLKGYRPDKNVTDADSIDAVRAILGPV